MTVEEMRPRPFPPKRLHFSQLKHIGRTPAHFRSAVLLGVDATPAMRFGTAVHVACLGGELAVFNGERVGNRWKAFKGLVAGEDYFVFDDEHKGKAWKKAQEDAAGRLIVTSDDVKDANEAAKRQRARLDAGRHPMPIVTDKERDEALRVRDALMAFGPSARLLQGDTEVPLEWEVRGLPAAGQLDVIGDGFITDLKVSGSAEPEWFERHAIFRMAWNAQLAWYQEGARQNDYRADDCFIVAVEPKPPYASVPRRLTADALEMGERTIRTWTERYRGCVEFDEWPAYVQSVIPLDVPQDDYGLEGLEDDSDEEAA